MPAAQVDVPTSASGVADQAGYFQPAGDPYKYKVLGDGETLSFVNTKTGELGQTTVSAVAKSNPQWARENLGIEATPQRGGQDAPPTPVTSTDVNPAPQGPSVGDQAMRQQMDSTATPPAPQRQPQPQAPTRPQQGLGAMAALRQAQGAAPQPAGGAVGAADYVANAWGNGQRTAGQARAAEQEMATSSRGDMLSGMWQRVQQYYRNLTEQAQPASPSNTPMSQPPVLPMHSMEYRQQPPF